MFATEYVLFTTQHFMELYIIISDLTKIINNIHTMLLSLARLNFF